MKAARRHLEPRELSGPWSPPDGLLAGRNVYLRTYGAKDAGKECMYKLPLPLHYIARLRGCFAPRRDTSRAPETGQM